MNTQTGITISPLQRLIRLLSNERKDIGYIYFYAIAVGLISLILPLGIQAVFNLVKTGSVFSSVYLLMALVIIGLLASGIMQIVQVSIVEVLQKRIFAKAAFDFTYRLPHIKTESIDGTHLPEMMNRFFDVLTIQKALPKFLIDMTGAALQIIFGLLLLSFYHPFFIAFALLVFFGLFVMVKTRGSKGLETSIKESKYKYKVVEWLESLATANHAFKLAGNTHLPARKMDELVGNYLTYRTAHFKILKGFYIYALVFKTLIIGGLLILGTYLLVNLQISLGQFVASEMIIVLLTSAVEKLILSTDIIFDLLTAVDKIGHVTDLDSEKQGGYELTPENSKKGIEIKVSDLSYQYPNTTQKALSGVFLNVKAGDSVCVVGARGSGKNTLTKILTGILTNYEGSIQYNNLSFNNLDIVSLRNIVTMNSLNNDIFDGTIIDNLTMGRAGITIDAIQTVLKSLDLNDEIAMLPQGLDTQLTPMQQSLSEGLMFRLSVARMILKRPKLLIFNDSEFAVSQKERLDIIRVLTNSERDWTLILMSNDPAMMAACQQVVVIKNGQITTEQ